MSTQDKYESRIRKAAILNNLEGGLREGGKCLICQCWKKPCVSCNGGRKAGAKADPSKSAQYERAAALLGSE